MSYAVLGKGVGQRIVGPNGVGGGVHQAVPGTGSNYRRATTGVDIGLPEVYDLRPGDQFSGATTRARPPPGRAHLVKQAVGVFASNDAADRAFHRTLSSRTVGCSGRATAILDAGTTQVWSLAGEPSTGTRRGPGPDPAPIDDAVQTRLRENVLLQARSVDRQRGPAVNVLAGAIQKLHWAGVRPDSFAAGRSAEINRYGGYRSGSCAANGPPGHVFGHARARRIVI